MLDKIKKLFRNGNENECNHEYVLVGLFYEKHLSEYSNKDDIVSVYEKHQCQFCKKYINKLISRQHFLPSRYDHSSQDMKNYIEQIENCRIPDELTLLLNFRGVKADDRNN